MKKILKVFIIILVIAVIIIFVVNGYVKNKYCDKIIELEKVNNIDDFEAIIVLGAKVDEQGKVSSMLKDRLDKAIEVYKTSNIQTIINSGNEQEVIAMSKYLEANGIDKINIKEDKKGLSTYESIKNLKEKFNYKKIVIVTQQYHLYRAIYIANELGIDAYGVSTVKKEYQGQLYRDIREVLARNKDFILSM